MKKIISILGARPQFVKAAVLSRTIAQMGVFEEIIVHTGQHYDKNMSDLFFEEMKIPKPKYNLNINGLSHGAMTGQMLEKIESILISEKADAVVVYGDTNSTLAGALAAKKLGIKLIHVEAGLRSFNMEMPEEINRILCDRISDLLLCPSQASINNLKHEGFEHFDAKVVLCGDIMKEAVEFYSVLSLEQSNIVADLNLEKNNFVLCTLHRQENTDNTDNLKAIVEAYNSLHDLGYNLILPLHPRTKKILEQQQLSLKIKVVEPLGYIDMLSLISNSNFVITDSGGLQKEAYWCKKACLITRQQTEWIELVDNNHAVICGANRDKIIQAALNINKLNLNFDTGLYGGTNIAQEIHREIEKILN